MRGEGARSLEAASQSSPSGARLLRELHFSLDKGAAIVDQSGQDHILDGVLRGPEMRCGRLAGTLFRNLVAENVSGAYPAKRQRTTNLDETIECQCELPEWMLTSRPVEGQFLFEVQALVPCPLGPRILCISVSNDRGCKGRRLLTVILSVHFDPACFIRRSWAAIRAG